MGARGPAPMPSRLRAARGNPGQRKLLPDEVQPARPLEMLQPPEWLGEVAATEWRRLAPSLFAQGLLTIADRAVFEKLLLAKWKQAHAELEARAATAEPGTAGGLLVNGPQGGLVENPLYRAERNAGREVLRFAQHFGLSPSARARGIGYRGHALRAGAGGDPGPPGQYDALPPAASSARDAGPVAPDKSQAALRRASGQLAA